MERVRVKNAKLSDIEHEQKLKNDALQRKAVMQLQENEEEIKRLNQVRLFLKPVRCPLPFLPKLYDEKCFEFVTSGTWNATHWCE